MKILIVDNGSNYIDKIKTLLLPAQVEIVDYATINIKDAAGFDAAILSGGHEFPVVGNAKKYKNEIDLIKRSEVPIFGICLGFELIANAFGAKLKRMGNKEHGIIDITVVNSDRIFANIPNFKVYESHRWVVKDAGEELTVLAKSKDGVEAFRHKTRPVYGVQFHPEMFIEKTCGDEILHNFIESIK